uniref:Ig-like domain-containing protein n=1 Tax=Canis lupus familiaris TaxID=9615 RepID=A0A8C0RPN2_CANLF
MDWTLSQMCYFVAGSLSQPVLTQPPSLSASLGTTARLTCTLSSGFSVGGYYIYWYQQKPQSPPRCLLYYYSDSDKHQGSRVPSRFSGSKDTSANAGLLLISGLQPEDEADYYCNIWYSSSSAHIVLQTHKEIMTPPKATERFPTRENPPAVSLELGSVSKGTENMGRDTEVTMDLG